MKLERLEKILSTLDCISIDKSREEYLDMFISKLVINNLGIKYLFCKEHFFTILDLMSIEYAEVYTQIYKITEIYNNEYSDLAINDLVINPKTFLPNDINNKDVIVESELHIVRFVNGDEQIFVRPVRIELKKTETNSYAFENMIAGNDVCYIRLNDFQKVDYELLENKLRNKLILDLRNNKGGRISDMKHFFETVFPGCLLWSTVSNKIMDFQIQHTKNNLQNRKICILINKNTASAAEIFALLCRTYFHAKLIGASSYGKNVVCKNYEVKGIAYNVPYCYYTVNGHNVEEQGIVPDVYCESIDDFQSFEVVDICNKILEEEEDEKVFGYH